MPEANKPPIGLTDQEVLSVIAYLQTLGGEATVTMQTRLAYTGGAVGGNGAAEAAPADGDVADGNLLSSFGCSKCHYSDQPGKLEASSLYDVGARYDRDQLFLKLSQHEREENLDRATLGDLQNLVQTLSELKG